MSLTSIGGGRYVGLWLAFLVFFSPIAGAASFSVSASAHSSPEQTQALDEAGVQPTLTQSSTAPSINFSDSNTLSVGNNVSFWAPGIWPLRAKTTGATHTVGNIDTVVNIEGVGERPLYKSEFGIYPVNEPVTLGFTPSRAPVSPSSGFDDRQAQIVVAQVESGASVPRSLNGLSSFIRNNDSAEYEIVHNGPLPIPDGFGAEYTFSVTPDQSGQYVVFMAAPQNGSTGFSVSSDNELTQSGNVTLFGMETLMVQQSTSQVTPPSFSAPGGNATFGVDATGLGSASNVSHTLILYDNQTFENAAQTFTITGLSGTPNITYNTDIKTVNGETRIQNNPSAFGVDLSDREITRPFDAAGLLDVVASDRLKEGTVGNTILNASVTVVKTDADGEVSVGVPANWTPGSYRWIHVASADGSPTMVTNSGVMQLSEGTRLSLNANQSTINASDTVRFSVTNNTGGPVNANITIENSTWNTTVSTGADGVLNYTFDSSGSYTVTADKEDTSTATYVPDSTTVDVLAPANLSIADYSVSNDSVWTNETIFIGAGVQNTGDWAGTMDVTLYADGVAVNTTTVEVGPNNATTVSFQHDFDTTGTHNLTVNNEPATDIEVTERPPAEISITNVSYEPETTVAVNQTITANITIKNTGGEAGEQNITIYANDRRKVWGNFSIPAQSTIQLPLEFSFTQAGTYDLSVNGIPDSNQTIEVTDAEFEYSNFSVTPDSVTQNGTFTASVDVENIGSLSGNSTPTLKIDGVTRNQTIVELEPGDQASVELSHYLDQPGQYNFSIDGHTEQVRVNAPTDIEVTNLVVPATVTQNESTTITVDATNNGDLPGDYTLNLTVNGTVVAQNASATPLAGGETRTVEFTYDFPTQRGDTTVSVGELSDTTTVQKPATLDVTAFNVTPRLVETGQTITANATVVNTGDIGGSTTIVLDDGSSTVNSTPVNVDAGSTTEVVLTHAFTENGTYEVSMHEQGETPPSDPITVEAKYPADVAITDVSYDPDTTVPVNDTLSVNVTLANTGGFNGSRTVDLYVNGTNVNTSNVEVSGHSTAKVSFQTKLKPFGPYNVSVDGKVNRIITATNAVFTYADPAVNPTELVGPGQVSVSANVSNDGNIQGTQTVNLTRDGTVVDSQPVTIAPGQTQRVTFTPTVSTPGVHTFSIGGLANQTVRMKQPANITYGNLSVPASTVKGTPAPITVNVTNTGDVEGNYSVVLYVNGIPVNATSDTIAGNTSKTVTVEHGFATVRGQVDVWVNDLPAKQVQVNAPASFQYADLIVSPSQTLPGAPVTVSALVSNTGDLNGTYNATLTHDGTAVDNVSSELTGGAAERVVFTTDFQSAGTYTVSIEGLPGESVTVLEPADVSYENLQVTPTDLTTGETVAARVDVNNTGDAAGRFTVVLKDDGTPIAYRTGVIAGNTVRTITLSRVLTTAGTHQISVNDLPSQQVTVEASDITSPSITLTNPSQGDVTYGRTLSFQVTDASNIDTVSYEVQSRDGSTTRTGSASPSGTSTTFDIDTNGLPEGSTDVLVTATDEHGNTITSSYTFDLVSQPKISSVSPRGTVGAQPTIDVAYSDNGQGDAGINTSATTLYVNGNEIDVNPSQIGFSETLSNTNVSTGSNSARVVVTDQAGHTASRTWTFSVDDTAPTVSVAAAPDGNISFQNPTRVTLLANDANLENANVTIEDPSGNVVFTRDVSQTVKATAGRITFTWSPDFGAESGEYTATVRARDAYANANSTNTTITVDTTNPTHEFQQPSTGVTVNGSQTLTVSGTADDVHGAVSSVRYRLWIPGTGIQHTVAATESSGTWSAAIDTTNLRVDDTYAVSAIVTDAAGNRNFTTADAEVTVDSTPPKLSASITRVDSDTGRVNVTTPGESLSGSPAISVDRPTGSNVSVTATKNDGIWSGTFPLNGSGTYTATVTGEDAVGNSQQATATGQYTTVDTNTTTITAYLEQSGIFVQFETNEAVNQTFVTLSGSETPPYPFAPGQTGLQGLSGQVGEKISANLDTENTTIGFPASGSPIPPALRDQVTISLYNTTMSPPRWVALETTYNTNYELKNQSGGTVVSGPYWTAHPPHFSDFAVNTSDSTPPTITFEQEDSAAYAAGTESVWVNATINDTLNQIDANNVTVYRNGTDVTENTSVSLIDGQNASVTYNATELVSGETYNITVEADDANGNVNVSTTNVTIEADTTEPTVTIDAPAENQAFPIGTDTLSINASYGDAETGINRSAVAVSLDDGANLASGATELTSDHVNVTASGLAAGSHNVTVTVADEAGNTATDMVNVTIKADDTAPTIERIEPQNQTYENTTTSVPVKANITDSGLGVDASNVSVLVNGQAVTANVTDLTNVTHTISTVPGYDGNVTVVATDAAGNTANNTTLFDVAPDTAAPTVTNVTPADNTNLSSTTTSVPVTINYTDTLTGVDTNAIAISVDGTDVGSNQNVSNVAITQSNATFTIGNLTPGSSHGIIVAVRDQAGNSVTNTTTFTVNNGPDIQVNGTNLSDNIVTAGQQITVNATLENYGDESGTMTAGLFSDGNLTATNTTSVTDGSTANVKFTTSFGAPGKYNLTVNGTSVGTVAVTNDIEFTSLSANTTSVQQGSAVNFTATVQNFNTSAVDVTVTLENGGTTVDTKTVTVPDESTSSVTFTRTLSTVGNHTFTVNGQHPVDVTVLGSTFAVQQGSASIPGPITAGESATISVDIANTGNRDGTESVSFTATPVGGGSAITDSKTITIAQSTTRTVDFTKTFSSAGTYTITVNGVTLGTLRVNAVNRGTDNNVGGGTGGGTGAPSQVSIDRQNGRVTVSVQNAGAGRTVRVDTSVTGTGTASPQLNQLAVTFAEESSGSVSVSGGQGNAPPVSASQDLGYFTIDHEVSDSAISSVTFDFTVNTQRLTDRGVDPGDVVLYRYHDGSWQALETRHVGTSGGVHTFEATSPGLSVFAVSTRQAQQPAFQVTDASLNTDTVTAGETFTVTATVENTGSGSGTYTLEIRADDSLITQQDVQLAAGESRQVTVDATWDQPGTWTITAGDVTAGDLTVESAGTTTTTTTTTTSTTTTTQPPVGGPVTGPVVVWIFILLAIMAAAVGYLYRQGYFQN